MSSIWLKIDNREHAAITQIAAAKPATLTTAVEALPLGDFIVMDGDTEVIIFERKTLADLSASITDGRYDEQSLRLSALPTHNHNIVYLVEGNLATFKCKERLYSAIFSLTFYKGFTVMRSQTLAESVTILLNACDKLAREKLKGRELFYSVVNVAADAAAVTAPVTADYCTVVNKVKGKNVTKQNIGNILLAQIPGVSSAIAGAIMDKFQTFPQLVAALAEDPTCLNGVTTTTAAGQVRKVSKTAIKTIVDFLTDSADDADDDADADEK